MALCCLLGNVWEILRRWKVTRYDVACEDVVVVRDDGPTRKESSAELKARAGGNRIDGGMGGYVRM